MRLIAMRWDDFQQYKDRKPSWIKLHRDLLNNYAYASVRISTKAVLPLLWLLASEYDDGIIEADINEIAFRIHIDVETLEAAITELCEVGFFKIDDSVRNCTEAYKNVPRDREEKETEKEIKIEKKQKIVTNDHVSLFESFGLTIEHIELLIKHRKEIKKPLKTSRGLTGLLNNVVKCIQAGYEFQHILERMQEKEWQSIEVGWMQKTMTGQPQLQDLSHWGFDS